MSSSPVGGGLILGYHVPAPGRGSGSPFGLLDDPCLSMILRQNIVPISVSSPTTMTDQEREEPSSALSSDE